MSDGAGNRTCVDLDGQKALRPARRIIDDGRAPDSLTGFPLESDEEFRARLTHPKALQPTDLQLQRIRELQGQPMALWAYVRNVVVEACAKKCESVEPQHEAGAERNDCAIAVRELAAPIVVRAEGHFEGPIPSLR